MSKAASPTLLTTVSCGTDAKKADVPDSVFDELFGDWSHSATPKAGPVVEKNELRADPIHGSDPKKARLPDDLFDKLTVEWSHSATPIAAPFVEKVELVDVFREVGRNGEAADIGHARPANIAQHAHRPSPTWGKLGDVDDIFAELYAA